jgi:hypothetical protein
MYKRWFFARISAENADEKVKGCVGGTFLVRARLPSARDTCAPHTTRDKLTDIATYPFAITVSPNPMSRVEHTRWAMSHDSYIDWIHRIKRLSYDNVPERYCLELKNKGEIKCESIE